MNAKQLIGGVLIILALALAYDGIKKFDNSTAEVKFLGIHINASDKGGQQTAFIELALAAAALLGGISLMRSKK